MTATRICITAVVMTLSTPPGVPAQRKCAQTEAVSSEITIAGEQEPGDRLTVEGIVTDDEGQPVTGAIVYVYHTDARGLYAPPGEDASVARLCGLMRTGTDGRYRFHTIWPASYPGGGVPRHVHYVVSGPDIETQRFELRFAGDPLISESSRERDRRRHEGLGTAWATIQPLARDDSGVLKCTRNLQVNRR